MRLSTSTCIHEHELWSNEMCYTAKDAIKAIADAGFKVMDMNFHSYSGERLPMTQGNWEDWVKEQNEYMLSLGLTATQAHAFFSSTRMLPLDSEKVKRTDELIRRSIVGAGIMDIPWIVIHPDYIINNTWYDRKASIKLNIENFKKYGELAKKHNVGIAIENMFEPETGRRYGTSAEELLDLLDMLDNDPVFGICWDFGHANIVKLDQCGSLREIGSRLHALHVDDNDGISDQHNVPYLGNIQWKAIMETLVEIGYVGDFTYEIHNFANPFPHELHPEVMKFSFDVGNYLLSLAKP